MDGFEVDPDGLVAAAALADRQRDHLARIDDHVGDVCGHGAAFSGVLTDMRDDYEAALEAVHDGLRQSGRVAEKVGDCFRTSSADYLDTDRGVHEALEALCAPLGISLAGYRPPGSGYDVPAAATAAPLTAAGAAAVIARPGHSWAARAAYRVGTGMTEAVSSHADLLEDPLGTVRSRVSDAVRLRAGDLLTAPEKQRVQFLEQVRRRGLSDSDAVDRLVTGSRVDAAAGELTAGTRAFEELNRAGRQAGDLVADVQQLARTREDLTAYEAFEAAPEDRSVQEWAS